MSDNNSDKQEKIEDLIILGGGPAGYTAALYAARAELDPLVIEGFQWGGQLQNTTDVENYPGYVEGVMGPEMMTQFRAQAERFGSRFVSDDATEVKLTDGGIHEVHVGKDVYKARAVILSMGAEPKRLDIPGETELAGMGVSTCGVCDGAFFKGDDVAVIGGGDTAMEDSIFISKFADKLTIIHRRDDFRASPIMEERARGKANIEVLTPYKPLEFVTGDDGKIASIKLENTETGEAKELEVGGAFVAIGHTPRSELVAGQVDVDENGYVKVEEPSTKTKLDGVFAVGDLVDHTYRQAVTAAGSGCKGALDAEAFLRDMPAPSPEEAWAREPGEIAKAVEAS